MNPLKVPTIFTAKSNFGPTLKGIEKDITRTAATAESRMRKLNSIAGQVAIGAGAFGAALALPLGIAAKKAIEFEDKLTDVSKTTGLNGKELSDYGDAVLDMSMKTRTGINDLLKIGEIGGQLGIPKEQLIDFTKAMDQFNVALGKDFEGGIEQASSSIGKIKNLFKDTRGEAVSFSEAVTKTGSAINELGAQGAGTSANITDFTLRMGALPDAVKPSLSNVLALGTYFEELGLVSDVAAGGLSHFYLIASRKIGAFSKQIGVTKAEGQALLASDPTEFAKRFAASLNGLPADKVAKKLHGLRINTAESIKVIGALGSNTERLTYLQNLSNQAYQQGTSLQSEYNKKNNNTAAMVAKAKNSFEAFSIILGRELLPIINELAMEIVPIVKSAAEWVKNNKELTVGILKAVGALAALSFAVSGVAAAVKVWSGIQLIFAGLTPIIAESTAATWLLNFAMMANPAGLIVGGVLALGSAIYLLTENYKELIAEYERGINKRVDASMQTEISTVETLVQKYQKLGMSMRDATSAAIKFEQTTIALDRIKLDTEIADLQKKVQDKQVNLGVYGGVVNLPGASELQDKLIAKQQQRTKNMSESLALTNFAIGQTQQGTFSKEQLEENFSSSKLIQKENVTNNNTTSATNATLTIKNDSNSQLDLRAANQTTSIMPKTTSTQPIK